jgi:hypothetical protein
MTNPTKYPDTPFGKLEAARAALAAALADEARVTAQLAEAERRAESLAATTQRKVAETRAALRAAVLSGDIKAEKAAFDASDRKAAYDAESLALEHIDIVRSALAELSARARACAIGVEAAERGVIKAMLASPESRDERIGQIEHILAIEVVEARIGGRSSFEFGTWIDRVVNRDRVHVMAKDIAQRLLAGGEV